MTKFSIKSARGVAAVLLAPMLLGVGLSCTNLTEVPHDALTPENAFTSDASILAGVAGVYSTLRDVEGNGSYESMQDLTTDVSVVPTRGSDWLDNGQWLDIHHQTYTPNSNGTLGLLNGDWNAMFGAVAKENLMLDVVAKSLGTKDTAAAGKLAAELRLLRAWDYYMLQDMWGGVPLVTSTELKQYPSVSRDSIFRFISSELQWARQRLPVAWPPQYYGRVTKGAANAILASLYLNAAVFTKDSKGINPTGYNSCMTVNVTVDGASEDACQAAIDAATAVIDEKDADGNPVYQLEDNWFKNFSIDNKSSTENIFVIEHVLGSQGIGGSWPMWTLHYNQLTTGWGGPWNGFATTAETFAKFDTVNDVRAKMWLWGRAMSFDSPGTPVNDRQGKPLYFTDTIGNLSAASEGEGVRFNKFPPVTGKEATTGQSNPNDFPFFRLTEMYLIRAEAENEKGNTAGAVTDLLKIHNMRDKAPIANLSGQQAIRDAIMRERLLEFAMEGKRRSDMIRYGTFTTWTEKSKNGTSAPRDYHVVLFPVPAPQLASNPLLTQNPGY